MLWKVGDSVRYKETRQDQRKKNKGKETARKRAEETHGDNKKEKKGKMLLMPFVTYSPGILE